MSILKDTIEYINTYNDDLIFSLYNIEDYLVNNKKYKKPLKFIFWYLGLFQYCQFIVPVAKTIAEIKIIPVAKTIAETKNKSVPYDYFFRKNGNIPFPVYLTKAELEKMYLNTNYIKTFERKCKIKKLKKCQ